MASKPRGGEQAIRNEPVSIPDRFALAARVPPRRVNGTGPRSSRFRRLPPPPGRRPSQL